MLFTTGNGYAQEIVENAEENTNSDNQNDKQPDESIDYYDRNWNFLDLRQNFPNSSEHLPRPQKLDEMLDIAELLADGKNFIRVDLYVINGDVYFSEFTFFSDAGFERFYPDEWDYTLGKWIDL